MASTAEAGATPSHRTKSLVVSTAKDATLGTILISGNTVYTVKASRTPCAAACVKFWPRVLLPKGVKRAKAGKGVKAAKLGTIKRSGGVLQVTYAGKPMYRFMGDTGPGQVHGILTNRWGSWSVVVTARPAQTAGTPTSSPAPAPTTTSTSTANQTAPTSTANRTAPTSPAPVATTTPTSPPATTTTNPPTTTTTTTRPPTTTTTSGGGGGVGF